MKTMMIVLALMVIAGVCLGFYLNWFNFSTSKNRGNSSVTLTVDKDKIEADKDDAIDKARNLGQKAVDKIPPTPPKPQE